MEGQNLSEGLERDRRPQGTTTSQRAWRRGWSGWRSVVQQALPPVEAVVGAVGDGQDGGVHQLPLPRVPLLLAGTEAQVRDLGGGGGGGGGSSVE